MWILSPRPFLPNSRKVFFRVRRSISSCFHIKLKRVIDRLANRKGVVFHQDNARPHVSLMARQKLLWLRWDVLVHPPYSPDLAPSAYHLFRALQNNLNNKIFSSLDVLKNHLDDFFAQKSQDFYERGIMKLVER